MTLPAHTPAAGKDLGDATRVLGTLAVQLPKLRAVLQESSSLEPLVQSALKALGEPPDSPDAQLVRTERVARSMTQALGQLSRSRAAESFVLPVRRALEHVQQSLRAHQEALRALQQTRMAEVPEPALAPEPPPTWRGSSRVGASVFAWSGEGLQPSALVFERPAKSAVAAPDGGADVAEPEEEEPPPSSLDDLQSLATAMMSGASVEDATPVEADPELAPLPPRAPLNEALWETHLRRLGDHWATRDHLQRTRAGTWPMLERLEERLTAHTEALLWSGQAVVPFLVDTLEAAKAPADAFAAALPLLTLRGPDAVDVVMAALRSSKAPVAEALCDALQLAPHPMIAARLPALLDAAAPAHLQAGAARVLGCRGLLPVQAAQALLGSSSPEVLAATGTAILEAGMFELLPLLETCALSAKADETAGPVLLTAAAVLGSRAALEEVRHVVRTRAAPTPALLLALAACGSEEDVPLVERFAQAPETLGEASRRATAWLKQWSLSASMAALEAPATTLAERELAFWDLTARTGQHHPFHSTAIVVQQRRSAAAWRARVEPVAHRFPPGVWRYRGQAHPARGTA